MVKKHGSEETIKALKENEVTAKNTRMALKIQSIRLVYEGYSIQEAAKITNCSEKTVYNNLNKYDEGGIAALYRKPNTGRVNKLTSVQEEELYNVIKTKMPNEVGFAPFANWTSFLAVKWIDQNFNVKFSDRGVRNLFKRLALSYTRPTYTLKKADPEKQEAFKEAFEQVKKS